MRAWPASNVASSRPPHGTHPVFATLRTCRAPASSAHPHAQHAGGPASDRRLLKDSPVICAAAQDLSGESIKGVRWRAHASGAPPRRAHRRSSPQAGACTDVPMPVAHPPCRARRQSNPQAGACTDVPMPVAHPHVERVGAPTPRQVHAPTCPCQWRTPTSSALALQPPGRCVPNVPRYSTRPARASLQNLHPSDRAVLGCSHQCCKPTKTAIGSHRLCTQCDRPYVPTPDAAGMKFRGFRHVSRLADHAGALCTFQSVRTHPCRHYHFDQCFVRMKFQLQRVLNTVTQPAGRQAGPRTPRCARSASA